MHFLTHHLKAISVNWTNEPLWLPEELCTIAEQLKPSIWDGFFNYRKIQREQLLLLSCHYEALNQTQATLSQAESPIKKSLNQATVRTWLAQTEQVLIQEVQAELITYTETKIHSLSAKQHTALSLAKGYNRGGWLNTIHQESYNTLRRCGSAVNRITHSLTNQSALAFKTIYDLMIDIQTAFGRRKANATPLVATFASLLQYYRSILHRIAETIGESKAYKDYPRSLRQALIQQLDATLSGIDTIAHLSTQEKDGLVKLTQQMIAFLELPSPTKTARSFEAHESPLRSLHLLKPHKSVEKLLQRNLLAEFNNATRVIPIRN